MESSGWEATSSSASTGPDTWQGVRGQAAGRAASSSSRAADGAGGNRWGRRQEGLPSAAEEQQRSSTQRLCFQFIQSSRQHPNAAHSIRPQPPPPCAPGGCPLQ